MIFGRKNRNIFIHRPKAGGGPVTISLVRGNGPDDIQRGVHADCVDAGVAADRTAWGVAELTKAAMAYRRSKSALSIAGASEDRRMVTERRGHEIETVGYGFDTPSPVLARS